MMNFHNNNAFSIGGVHLRNDLLTLEYQPGKPLFKTIGRKTSNLVKMGIHRKDGDFLYIEEALYLADMGAALVVDHRGGGLTIQQLYALLSQMHISALKYAVFAQLVRAGYIVRRANYCQSNSDHSPQSEEYPIKMRSFLFPKEFLDQFPNIRITDSADSRSSRLRLDIPNIHQNSTLFAKDSPDSQIELTNEWMSKRQLMGSEHLAKVRRWDRGPWEQLRPRYWPNFHPLRSAENWKVYEMRRELLLRKPRTTNRNLEHQKRKREPTSYDYELFADASPKNQSVYRVLVVDERFPPRHPTFFELEKMAEATDSSNPPQSGTPPPLLVATGSPTCLKISQLRIESGQSLTPFNNCDLQGRSEDTRSDEWNVKLSETNNNQIPE